MDQGRLAALAVRDDVSDREILPGTHATGARLQRTRQRSRRAQRALHDHSPLLPPSIKPGRLRIHRHGERRRESGGSPSVAHPS